MLIAGLTNNHSEFFVQGGKIFLAKSGCVFQKKVITNRFHDLLWLAIQGNPQVKKGLEILGLKDKKSQILKYFQCNYSDADHDADLTKCGKLGEREFISCAKRCGGCPAEGLLCKIPYHISNRELQVLKLIGIGFLDKEICASLNIAQDTLRNHKDSISRKTGLSRKAQLSILANKLKLV
jgi:DNA-binding CsgD family transcriptional regulator